MFVKYCEAQKLKAIINDGQEGQLLRDKIPLLREAGSTNSIGTFEIDMVDQYNTIETPHPTIIRPSKAPKATTVDYVKAALKKWCEKRKFTYSTSTIEWVKSFEFHGVTFTTSTHKKKDSHVVIGGKQVREQKWHAADIQHALNFTYTAQEGIRESQILLVTRRYATLSPDDTVRDNYRKYPIVGGMIFYDRHEKDRDLVSLDRLICHFVKTRGVSSYIKEKHFHASPLDKVRMADNIVAEFKLIVSS